jgi:hypothetical protein
MHILQKLLDLNFEVTIRRVDAFRTTVRVVKRCEAFKVIDEYTADMRDYDDMEIALQLLFNALEAAGEAGRGMRFGYFKSSKLISQLEHENNDLRITNERAAEMITGEISPHIKAIAESIAERVNDH